MLAVTNATHHDVITDDQHFYSESSVVQLANNELLITSPDNRGLAHTDAGSVVLSRSRDGGVTWENEPRQFIFRAGESDGYSSGPLSVLSDGTLMCHADHARFLVDTGDISHIAPRGASQQETVYLARSADNGATWETPYPVRITPMQGCYVRDGILEMPDGTLLMPLSGARHTISHKFPPSDNDPLRSYLLRSEDRGKTWHYFSAIAFDPAGVLNLWEPTLTRLPSGRLVALLRSDYLFMIAPPGGELYCAYSDDEGASWSNPHRLPFWGYPADLITLKDGTALAVFGHRRDPMSIRVAVSEDGITWKKENMITLRDVPLRSLPQSRLNFSGTNPHPALATYNVGFRHIGYPDTKQLSDGRIITVYHTWNEELRQQVECSIYSVEYSF